MKKRRASAERILGIQASIFSDKTAVACNGEGKINAEYLYNFKKKIKHKNSKASINYK